MSKHWWNGPAWQTLAIVMFAIADGWARWIYFTMALAFVIDYAVTSRLAYWQRRLIDARKEAES